MKKKKDAPKSFFIRVANGTWATPEGFAKHGISQKDIKALRSILSNIIKNNGKIESWEIRHFKNIYSSRVEVRKYNINDGLYKTIEHPLPFCAATTTGMMLAGTMEKKSPSRGLYELSKNFLTFLSEKGNPQKIKQCSECNLFFIAKDKNRKRCYEKKCSNTFHRRDMAKRRDEHPEIYKRRYKDD